jgi:RNA polymerase sigma-70 factor (ECF subfamily)
MSNKNLTDSELVRTFVKDGSDDAFDEIVRQKYRFVFAVCYRKLQNEMLAQDSAQAVFITLAQKRCEIKLNCSLSAWLFKIALLSCSNTIRIEERNRHREARAEEMMKTNIARESPVSLEARDLLIRAVSSLSEADRSAVLMRFIDNLPIADIAEALRTSPPAASQRVARALENLRRYFAKNGSDLAVDAVSTLLCDKLIDVKYLPDIDETVKSIRAAIEDGGSSLHTHSSLISQGVIQQMKILKIKLIAATVCGGAALIGGGFGIAGYAALQQNGIPIPNPIFTAPWPSQDKPSVQFLLTAWKKADTDVRDGINGYQLDGSSKYFISETLVTGGLRGKKFTPKSTVSADVNGDPVQESSWTWRQAGYLFYVAWKDRKTGAWHLQDPHDYGMDGQTSFDGYKLYASSYDHTPGAHNDAYIRPITKRNSLRHFADEEEELEGADAWPPRKECVYSVQSQKSEWLDNFKDEYAEPKHRESLLEIYERLSGKLTVSGPETVDGRTGYSLCLDTAHAGLSSDYRYTPDKVTFVYITPDHLLPVQQHFTIPYASTKSVTVYGAQNQVLGSSPSNKPGTTENIFKYTDFSLYRGKYILPTHWTSFMKSMDDKGHESINYRFDVQLKWSRINDRFTPSDFHFKLSPGVRAVNMR